MKKLSPKVQEAFDLWMSIDLSDEYHAWCARVDMPRTAWQDMSDEKAERIIELFRQYKEGD